MLRLPVACVALAAVFAAQPYAARAEAGAVRRSWTARALAARFEPNVGQADSRALWIARTVIGPFSITRDGFVLPSARNGRAGSAIEVRFVGAQAPSRVRGVGRVPGVANYLIGRDPSGWHTGVPLYARARQVGLYPGIDLQHYGADSRLEHDFIIRPGADPGRIAFEVRGAEVRLLPNGDLSLQTGADTVRLAKPVAYQQIAGRRRPVRASYRLAVLPGTERCRIAFDLGPYDRGRELVIDPVVTFSTFLGGSGDDYPYSVALDATGAVYVAGYTTSTNFPTTAGAFDRTLQGADDAFVTKFAPDGQTLVYSTFIGGSDYDTASDLAVDSAGCAYIIGGTTSLDLPVTAGAFQTVFPTWYTSAFVAKLSSTGSALAYCTYFGDGSHTYPGAICVDGNGSAFICGTGTGAPLTSGSIRPGPGEGGNYEAYVAQLTASGSGLVYGAMLGSTENDYGRAIAVRGGVAYVACAAGAAGFPVTPGAYSATFAGNPTLCVAAVAPGGASLEYSTFVGRIDVSSLDIAVDDLGCAYVTGEALEAAFPTTPGAYNRTFVGWEPFVLKLNPSGSDLAYSTFLGAGEGSGTGISLWGHRACVVGWTRSASMPTTPDALQAANAGQPDAFAVVLNSAGSAVDFATYVGGQAVERPTGIAADGAGRLYLTGWTDSADYWSHRALQPAIAPGYDGFLTCVDLNGSRLGSSLYVPDRTAVITTPVTLKAYLTEVGSSVTPRYRRVRFSVAGTPVGAAITDATGKAQLSWVVDAGPISRQIRAEFAGDYAYLPSAGVGTLTAQTLATKVYVPDRAGRTYRVCNEFALTAYLNTLSNVPVPNRSLAFSVDGTSIGSAVTNDPAAGGNGRALITWYVAGTWVSGSHVIQVDWAGDAGYLASMNRGALTLAPADVYIWPYVRTATEGDPWPMRAYVRTVPDYVWRPGLTISFRLDVDDAAHEMGTAVTDASGIAWFTGSAAGVPVGTHTIYAHFDGNASFAAASASTTARVLARP